MQITLTLSSAAFTFMPHTIPFLGAMAYHTSKSWCSFMVILHSAHSGAHSCCSFMVLICKCVYWSLKLLTHCECSSGCPSAFWGVYKGPSSPTFKSPEILNFYLTSSKQTKIHHTYTTTTLQTPPLYNYFTTTLQTLLSLLFTHTTLQDTSLFSHSFLTHLCHTRRKYPPSPHTKNLNTNKHHSLKMCQKIKSAKQLSERSRKAARSNANQKINKKAARHQAYIHNKSVRDTWVEDINLQFAGAINIPATEEKAIEIATEASQAAFDSSNLVFFTHGSSVPSKNTQPKETSPKHETKRLAGAAVIFKQPAADNTSSWRGRQWGLGHCETTNGAEAGFFAISKCLTLAAEHLHHAQHTDTEPTVTIFAHDQDEINKISRVRYIDSTRECSDATPVLLDIVKKSRKLRDNFGAAIELYCIPKHAAVRGNQLAEAAARKAASDQDLPAASD